MRIILLLSVGVGFGFSVGTYASDMDNKGGEVPVQKTDTKVVPAVVEDGAMQVSDSFQVSMIVANTTSRTIKVQMILNGFQNILAQAAPNDWRELSGIWEHHTQWKVIKPTQSAVFDAPHVIPLSGTPDIRTVSYVYTSSSLRVHAFKREKEAVLRNKKVKLKEKDYDGSKYEVRLKNGGLIVRKTGVA